MAVGREGIPTVYAGRRFRSRVEARWAAFFDLLEWKWEYEPFDLKGWIPDFSLKGFNEDVIVEVKSVSRLEDPIAVEAIAKAEKAMKEDSRRSDLLLLGHQWPDVKNWIDEVAFGWLGQYMGDVGFEGWSWAEAALGRWEGRDRDTKCNHSGYGFCHSEQSFHDRITGRYDGGRFGSSGVDQKELARFWQEAGNRVQWKPPS
jgi:hypothetical protein